MKDALKKEVHCKGTWIVLKKPNVHCAAIVDLRIENDQIDGACKEARGWRLQKDDIGQATRLM